MKKKLLTALLAGVMLVAFTGCGKKNDNSSDEIKHYEIGGTNYIDVTDYSSYVELGQYSNLNIEVAPADVTDKQVQEFIDYILDDCAEVEEIKEGVVGEKDTINMDFTGYLDGKAFENGSSKDYDYTIGGGFIESLDSQLPGLEVGKEYELECTFPKDYGKEELAGKDVIFKVTVNYIHGEKILPEWNDEFVKEYTSGKYTEAAPYEAYIREYIGSQNEQTQTTTYQTTVWSTILENCTIKSYPEDKLNEAYDEYITYYKSRFEALAEAYKMEYEEVLKAYKYENEEALEKACMEQAESELAYIMISCEIAKAEKIAITKDIYEMLAGDVIEQYSYEDIAQFESQYGQDYIMESFVFEGVTQWLYENNNKIITEDAIVTEEATTEAEAVTK